MKFQFLVHGYCGSSSESVELTKFRMCKSIFVVKKTLGLGEKKKTLGLGEKKKTLGLGEMEPEQ